MNQKKLSSKDGPNYQSTDKPRLINANDAKDIIKYAQELTEWQAKEACDCIDCCVTAYDIDKVVEQLEEISNQEEAAWIRQQREGTAVSVSSTDVHSYASSCFDEAIKIVKGGAK